MKSIDYTNDPRWEHCSDIHKEFGHAPNWFVAVLLANNIDVSHINIAIETGTHQGYTARFFGELFDEVYTVEAHVDTNPYTGDNLRDLYKEIKSQYPNINFYEGDSAVLLDKILPDIDQPVLILLDAHSHQQTPIKEELVAIKNNLKHKNSVIVIDDCDDVGLGDWPTMEELKNMILDINCDFNILETHQGRNIIICY